MESISSKEGTEEELQSLTQKIHVSNDATGNKTTDVACGFMIDHNLIAIGACRRFHVQTTAATTVITDVQELEEEMRIREYDT